MAAGGEDGGSSQAGAAWRSGGDAAVRWEWRQRLVLGGVRGWCVGDVPGVGSGRRRQAGGGASVTGG